MYLWRKGKRPRTAGWKPPPCSLYVRKNPNRGSLRLTESKFLPTVPKSAILWFCPSRENLLGSAFPKPCYALAPQKYSRPAKSFFSLSPRKWLTDKEFFVIVKGGLQPMPKRYNTPHRSRVVKTRPVRRRICRLHSGGLRPMVSASPNFSGRRYGAPPYAPLSMCQRSMMNCSPLSGNSQPSTAGLAATSTRLPGV